MTDTNGGPITFNDLKRKDVSASVFEANLNVEQCRKILTASEAHNVNFRKIQSSAKTALLVEAMKSNRWVWTDADPIRLHLLPDGEIVCSDGQHRLWSAVQARRTLRTLVLWGEQWKAGVHVDRNRNRNVSQFLQHDHGMKSAPVYVAVSRMHLARVVGYQQNLTNDYARNSLLDDETLIEFVLKNVTELNWAMSKGTTGGAHGFNTTAYQVFMFELLTISLDTANAFHNDIKNPALGATDPLTQLRRIVERRYNDTGLKMHREYTINNLVKAHNARQTGQELSKWINAPDAIVFPAGFKIDGKRTRTAT